MIYSKFKLFDRLPVDHQTYPLRGFEGISGPSKSTKYKYATTPYLPTNVDDHTYNNLCLRHTKGIIITCSKS